MCELKHLHNDFYKLNEYHLTGTWPRGVSDFQAWWRCLRSRSTSVRVSDQTNIFQVCSQRGTNLSPFVIFASRNFLSAVFFVRKSSFQFSAGTNVLGEHRATLDFFWNNATYRSFIEKFWEKLSGIFSIFVFFWRFSVAKTFLSPDSDLVDCVLVL